MVKDFALKEPKSPHLLHPCQKMSHINREQIMEKRKIMQSKTPNTHPFENLRHLIKAESERKKQRPVLVEISSEIACDLMKMDADDWYASTKGFTCITDCQRIAESFFVQGEEAVNGLHISIIGPTLKLANDLNAPKVRIIDGRPYQ